MTAEPASRSSHDTDRVIHLEDKRLRARERAEMITQGVTAFTLGSAAYAAYSRHALDGFVALDAAAALALGLTVIRGAAQLGRQQDAGSSVVNVAGLFGGLAAIAEGLHKLHSAEFTLGHKHFALGVVMVLIGLITLALAVMMQRIERGRALTISSDGIRMRLNKFRRFNMPWHDIAELQVGTATARLVGNGGKTCVVPLRRLVNSAEVREALIGAGTARGVKLTLDNS